MCTAAPPQKTVYYAPKTLFHLLRPLYCVEASQIRASGPSSAHGSFYVLDPPPYAIRLPKPRTRWCRRCKKPTLRATLMVIDGHVKQPTHNAANNAKPTGRLAIKPQQSTAHPEVLSSSSDNGAVIIRTGFWGPLYYNEKKEPRPPPPSLRKIQALKPERPNFSHGSGYLLECFQERHSRSVGSLASTPWNSNPPLP